MHTKTRKPAYEPKKHMQMKKKTIHVYNGKRHT